jgi:hypothetical protein
VDLTVCPECGAHAEIRWRAVLESTDGPIEHAKVLCIRRHWFLLPVSDLAAQSASAKRAAAARDATYPHERRAVAGGTASRADR